MLKYLCTGAHKIKETSLIGMPILPTAATCKIISAESNSSKFYFCDKETFSLLSTHAATAQLILSDEIPADLVEILLSFSRCKYFFLSYLFINLMNSHQCNKI